MLATSFIILLSNTSSFINNLYNSIINYKVIQKFTKYKNHNKIKEDKFYFIEEQYWKGKFRVQGQYYHKFAIYFRYFLKHLLIINDILYIVKKIVDLEMIYNKNVITLKKILAISF